MAKKGLDAKVRRVDWPGRRRRRRKESEKTRTMAKRDSFLSDRSATNHGVFRTSHKRVDVDFSKVGELGYVKLAHDKGVDLFPCTLAHSLQLLSEQVLSE